MTARFPMMLTLAALIGFASPALAAESHAAKHDPQTAATTTKGHKAPAAQEKAPVKGRHAKGTRSTKGAAKAASAKPAAPAAQQPAAR